MRRVFFVSLLFVVLFSSFFLPAELHSKENQSEPKESDGPIKANMFLWADQPRKFIAELAVTKKGQGTWTYYFDGQKIGTKKGNQSIEFQTPPYKVGIPHTVKVTFEGMVDGKEVHSSEEIRLPKVSYDYQLIKEKHQFSMSLSEVSSASGKWVILLKNEKGEIVKKCDTSFSKELAFHCQMEVLEEGKYTVAFLFNGTFDKMFPFAQYGIMREGVFTVTEKGKPGVLQLKETTSSPKSDQVENLIQNQLEKKLKAFANSTQPLKSEQSSFTFYSVLLIACIGLASLIILVVLKKIIANIWK